MFSVGRAGQPALESKHRSISTVSSTLVDSAEPNSRKLWASTCIWTIFERKSAISRMARVAGAGALGPSQFLGFLGDMPSFVCAAHKVVLNFE